MDEIRKIEQRKESNRNSIFAVVFFILILVINVVLETIDGISIASAFFIGYFSCKIKYRIR